MVNKELLKATIDVINAKPELHDQANWVRIEEENVCGTAMCFAGHAAILAGAEAPDPKKHYVADWFIAKGGKYLNWKEADAADADEQIVSVASYARNALGLDFETSDYMFDGDRTREELTEAVDDLLNDRPVVVYDDDEDDYDGGCPCCDY